MAYRTEMHRLELSRAEHDLLEELRRRTCALYNAGLEDRRNYWEYGKRLASAKGLPSPYLLPDEQWLRPTKQRGFTLLTRVRADDPQGWGALPASLGREVIERVDRAWQGVFKNGRGLPRFKSERRWRSFGWDEMRGVTIVGNTIVFDAFGIRRHLRFKRHKRHPTWPDGTILKTVRFVRKCNRWEVHIQISYPVASELVQIKPVMPSAARLRGLDDAAIKALKRERYAIAAEINREFREAYEAKRVAAFMAAFEAGEVRAWDANIENHATNDLGERIENPCLSERHRRRRSKVEAEIARRQIGSKRWRQSVARRRRLGERERNTNRTFAHQVSAGIVRQTPFLAREDLLLQNMTRSAKGTIDEPGTNVRAKSGLNREMLGNCHGMRVQYMTYKAERAGGLVIKVPPHGTSQRCSRCDTKGAISNDRVFHCPACGLAMDRDRNAALNILKRSWGVVAPGVGLPAWKDQREALAA